MGARWTRGVMPSQAGRRVLVTGGTRGLGRSVATALAARGAHVVITGTQPRQAIAVASEIEASLRGKGAPAGSVMGLGLDLADLDDVGALAEQLTAPIDCLVDNAGIMWGPYATTNLGVERQLAVNFLGHFALVGRLLPRLMAGRAPRVVSLSSTYHRYGDLRPTSLDVTADAYRPNAAYGASKLATLAFARELGRWARWHGLALTSVAAHPGWADTELQTLQVPRAQRWLMRVANATLAVPVDVGADPILCAASAPGLPSGVFVGPSRLGGYRGAPGIATSTAAANDPAAAARLWEWASARTGIRYLDS